MSKRRLWTLENNLSFALFSSFASRKRRRCVRFEKRNLSLVSPLAKSLKMRTNKLATLFRSSTRSFSSFKEREREIIMMAKQCSFLFYSRSLSLLLCLSLCVNVCADAIMRGKMREKFSSDALEEYLSTRVKRCETRNETTREAFHTMSTKRGGHFYHPERKTNDTYDRYETMRRKECS